MLQPNIQLQHEYSQVEINTKFGLFNIRVYADAPNKETVVLWTSDLDMSKPVLTRVHSDVIGSLQCDCGDQLDESLKIISNNGGVLIYLRQEGRGIELFEKIKAYQLQSRGIDTFEANVRLGHRPDGRTYETVKLVLDDLKISSIRLITNNPSKISEIAKLGINVAEQVPVVIEPNVHNKKYTKTKKEKFQHLHSSNKNRYYYQCQIDSPQQVKHISKFTNSISRDPLLRMSIGLSANSNSLMDRNEINAIEEIVKTCHSENITPILHFSFRESDDPLGDIKKLHRWMPFIDHLRNVSTSYGQLVFN